MKNITPFEGFYPETIDFYRQLKENNSREWFEANREKYNRFVLEPSRSFVVSLGERLDTMVPGVYAEPRINRSLFKIHRDVRFSTDKSPLKSHLAFYFWNGEGPRMEMPGFYFHIEPDRIFFAAGLYSFTREQLKEYRDSVVHEEYGRELEKILKKISSVENTSVGTLHYKKTPRGYDPAHPREELLRYSGVHGEKSFPESDIIFSPGLVDLCLKVYKPMLPLHKWCCDMIERMG